MFNPAKFYFFSAIGYQMFNQANAAQQASQQQQQQTAIGVNQQMETATAQNVQNNQNNNQANNPVSESQPTQISNQQQNAMVWIQHGILFIYLLMNKDEY